MAAHAPLQPSAWQRLAQRTLEATWTGVIPALLAALVVRDGLPSEHDGRASAITARLALPIGIALFFAFASLGRYWRFRSPGGRYASRLPAHLVPGTRDGDSLAEWAEHAALYTLLTRKRGRETAAAAFDSALGDLYDALQTGALPEARRAALLARAAGAPMIASARRREVAGVALAALAAAAAAVGVRARVASPYRVLSASMLPTLEPGDIVAGARAHYAPGMSAAAAGPQRGDVIVFRSAAVPLTPHGATIPDVLVKRVIGLPGDRVFMRGGAPVINDWQVPTCDAGMYLYIAGDGDGGAFRGKLRLEFLGDHTYLTVQAMSAPFDEPYMVEDGEVFVLGDNRSSSLDSRAFREGRGGGVPVEAIDGRVTTFLFGTRRSGDVDLGRLLRPMDALARSVHMEGFDTRSIDEGIARCLAARPASTSPPEPPSNAVANTSARAGQGR